jgi:hypothetical protein
LIFGDGVIVKADFTHTKDQFAGLDLYAGLVEALYEGFQHLKKLLKGIGPGSNIVRI